MRKLDDSGSNASNLDKQLAELFALSPSEQILIDYRHKKRFRLHNKESLLLRLSQSMVEKKAPSLRSDLPLLVGMMMQFVRHELCIPDFFAQSFSKEYPKSFSPQRQAIFNLDSLYGAQPEMTPFLFDQKNPAKFFLYKGRIPQNQQGTYLLGEPANANNLLLREFHLLLLKFHNFVVEYLEQKNRPKENLFEESQKLVRQHFQWMLVHDFLKNLIGAELLEEILTNGNTFFRRRPFIIPVEFSLAAFCLDSAILPSEIRINQEDKRVSIQDYFSQDNHNICWNHLNSSVNNCRKINSQLIDNCSGEASFYGNQFLQLGHQSQMNSGQQLARKFGIRVLGMTELLEHSSPEEVVLLKDQNAELLNRTPLWFYLLKEATILGNGQQLGPLGGRIVGEIIIGVLKEKMPDSILYQPDWQPYMGEEAGAFCLTDLLSFT